MKNEEYGEEKGAGKESADIKCVKTKGRFGRIKNVVLKGESD
jgi:hypothetical protein